MYVYITHMFVQVEAAGLSREQLVFAPRIKVKKHLRRAALCDVAVDTHEYNSGATAADTLFSGVPVIHLPGNKAVGRMLSAMLSSVRMLELIGAGDGIHVHMYMYTCTYTVIYVCIHTHTYVHTYVCAYVICILYVCICVLCICDM